jgi:hypothetical protein
MAIRAPFGRVLNQPVKTSTGVLVGMQVPRDIPQLLCAVCRDQFNVQWPYETANSQRMEANDGAVSVLLSHDLSMSSFAGVTFLLVKHDVEEVPPRSY